MKCLSIYPEYIFEIMTGKKTEEYRTWWTKHRGNLLLACTKTKYNKSHICLLIDLVECIKYDCDYGFKLENIRLIKPIPIKGRQRMYNTPFELEDLEIINESEKQKMIEMYKEWFNIKK